MTRFSLPKKKNLIGLLIAANLSAVTVPSVGYSQESMLEEIVVGFEVPKLISKDIFVQYDGTTVFVPVIEVFGILDYNVQADLAMERISGHLADKSDKFLIDLSRFRLKAPDVERELLRSDYFYDGRDFYLKINLFGELFGLHMVFDFSELRVKLPLSQDFPAFQKLERQKKRRKFVEKKEALRDVLTLPREKGYASGGAVDWRISANPVGGGSQHYNLEMGGMLLGGDLKLGGGGNTLNGFDTDQLDYRWHYYFENKPYLTQVDLGRFYTLGILGRSLVGVHATNRPQVRRKYFQTVQLTGEKEPGWEVELYIDGKLVDFQTTDETGRYDFNLDIFYGTSNAELRFYGPNGEMETREQHFRIPFNLIPSGEIEYSAAIGRGTGQESDRTFAQVGACYGLFRRLTSGLNVDLPLTPLENETPLYSFESTLQPATNLTLSGSVAPADRMEFDVNYTWPSIITVGAHVTSFHENVITNPVRQKYRRQLSFSCPLKIAGRYLGLRYNIAQDQFESFGSTNMTYGFNTSIRPVHLNYVGQYIIRTSGTQKSTELSSKIMGSIRFHRLFRPQFHISFDHTQNEVIRYGVLMSKRLWRAGQVTLSYEHSPLAGVSSFLVSIHFFTDFLDLTSRTQLAGKRVTMTLQQRGSVRFDHHNNRFMFDRRQAVGYGSAVVRPFLDENYNGLKDPTEENVPGLKARIAGAGGRPRGGDRTYYYDRLRPYDEYLVQIDQYSLDDPTLKPSNENYKVTLNPSVVTAIEVPIVTASEISGSVRRQIGDGTTGVGGVRVMLLNISKDILTEVPTFNDGEYYYLGLLPGSYRAYLDPDQLSRAGYRSEPESIEFDIKPVIGGEMIEDISFIMIPAPLSDSGE